MKNNKTTQDLLSEQLAKKSRANNANPELAKMNQSSKSRGFSVIPATALHQYNSKASKAEVKRSLDIAGGQYDWTKGTPNIDLLHQDKTATPSNQLLLDLYPNAEIALDFFKLSTTYTGDCIRVRRSSDNAELDIGFVDNYIDTASLLTFAGVGDAFIVRRYDQSGNGNDVFVATASSQPAIVNSGVLVTEGGIAMGDWDGTDDYLATALGLNFGTDARSIFTIQKADVINSNAIVSLTNTVASSGNIWVITPEIATRVSGSWISSTPISTIDTSLISNIYTSGTLFAGNSMWINGGSVTRTGGSDVAINTGNDPLIDGSSTDSLSRFNGRKGTLLIYKSDQSSNREAIENILKSNYSIT